MKYDPNYKPTGDAAKTAKLPDGFTITGSLRSGSKRYAAGDEKAYAETKPSQADVDRLVASGAITLRDAK